MSKFFDRLDRLSDIFGGKLTPDQIIDSDAKLAGKSTDKPLWYTIVISRLRLIILVIAFIAVYLIFLKSGSIIYLSGNGIEAVMYLVTLFAGLILIPLNVLAIIQRKLNFRNTLPAEQKEIYDISTKKRMKDFIILLAVSILVAGVFAAAIIYIIAK